MITMAAPTGANGASQGSLLTGMLPFLVIIAIFYFLMIRPQQKQQKKVREMLANLNRGDAIITRGGVYGTIFAIAENTVTVEIAENVKIKVTRDAIAAVTGKSN